MRDRKPGSSSCRGSQHRRLSTPTCENPPEEIGNLLTAMDQGHDCVGSIRMERQDSFFRRRASRAMNWLRERITKIRMTDQRLHAKCMRSRHRRCDQSRKPGSEYVHPQRSPMRMPAIRPDNRSHTRKSNAASESKYSMYALIRLNFDLVTGFSIVPLQVFSLLGMFVAVKYGVSGLYRRHRAALDRRRRLRSRAARAVGLRDILPVLPDRPGAIRPGPARRLLSAAFTSRCACRPRYVKNSGDTGTQPMSEGSVSYLSQRRFPVSAGAVKAPPRRAAGRHAYRQSRGNHLVRKRRATRGGARRAGYHASRPEMHPESHRADQMPLPAGLPVFVLLPQHACAGTACLARPGRRSACAASLLPRYRGHACPSTERSSDGEQEAGAAALHDRCQTQDASAISSASRRCPMLPDDTRGGRVRQSNGNGGQSSTAQPAGAAGPALRREVPRSLALGSYSGGRGLTDRKIDWQLPA